MHLIQISILVTDTIIENFEILELFYCFLAVLSKLTGKIDSFTVSHSQSKSTNIYIHRFQMPFLRYSWEQVAWPEYIHAREHMNPVPQ